MDSCEITVATWHQYTAESVVLDDVISWIMEISRGDGDPLSSHNCTHDPLDCNRICNWIRSVAARKPANMPWSSLEKARNARQIHRT